MDRAQIQEMCPKLPDSLSPFTLLEREAGHKANRYVSHSEIYDVKLTPFALHFAKASDGDRNLLQESWSPEPTVSGI